MRKIGLLLFSLLCVWKLNAQVLYPEVMSCFGGSAQNATVHLTFTAGEPLYTTVENTNNILTQGFNQTVFVSTQTTNIKEVEGYTLKVFPNPTQNIVNVEWQTEKTRALTLQITDMQGKTLLRRKTTNTSEQLDISAFADGLYILKISDNRQVIKTFKVQKNR